MWQVLNEKKAKEQETTGGVQIAKISVPIYQRPRRMKNERRQKILFIKIWAIVK